ncbi:3'(2'),5'-bisphosphate nucleotidase CysQ [Sphingopyxis sp. RIFCSPHIGHO2_12_FULL_65_19]|uniref:3'(2'),5'-bisphosphate nucleotidase CysQ n=1 Tax=Sphingopyxis sp. RIFCSPHIGHO2_12_FULL_65_19 TaxID=1802172 RepID=UPI0008B7FD06|nr:3'(2'),5'-bisphosphate nucleotidase CysQ [Sphingopyxis sp. RIFCSPHIGHO2_12_FULL_65_19]OHD07641.1 MAG: 3'(2'),5'-bisphosphate nucleotidase CysQ [Sphingopyxis sp. RIFCSPHIGHO2_12_FULL_65_19]
MGENDEQLAERLATAAGAILLDLRARGDLDGKALGQAGDQQANAMLCREIRAARPDDALLSEEEKDNQARCGRRRVWIVDPLDGTREYGEGRDDWAVHVALAVDGVAAVGAVALPGFGITLTSGAPVPLQPMNQPLKMLVSRTRPAAEAVFVAERLGAELLAMGSAGAKAMAVVRGEADIYLHTGGQYEWDNCAPVAVAQAAGLHVSRVDGSAIRYNNADTYLPDLLICRSELAEEVLRLAAQYSRG